MLKKELRIRNKCFIITTMDTATLKSLVSEIGKIIRRFREKTGRNLADVALSAGISTSMLSQIERGVVSPSIETLFEVCRALKLDIGDLFGRLSPRPSVRVFKPQERLRTENKGIRYEQLITSSDLSHAMEMFILEVAPGQSIGVEGKGHEGVELGYVLEGEALMTVETTQNRVSKGDSMAFSSHLPHHLQNSGNSPFKAIWAISPPHRDYLEQDHSTTAENP